MHGNALRLFRFDLPTTSSTSTKKNRTSDPPTKELILSLNASKPQHLKFVIEDRLDDEHLFVDAKATAEIQAFVRAKGEEVSFQAPPREAAA